MLNIANGVCGSEEPKAILWLQSHINLRVSVGMLPKIIYRLSEAF